MSDKSMNKVFLMALSEPEYARLDFWISEQEKSIYSKNVFLKKLMEAFKHYEYQIDKRRAEFKALNPGSGEPAFKLPLVYETNGELTGHFGNTELQSLLLSIQNLLNKWVPKKDKPEPQVKNIQPINWLNGVESLRLFIEELKKAGMIEERQTEDIIQEHFDYNGKKVNKVKSVPQPINWLKSKVLLAYLIEELTTKPERYDPFMESDKKWHLTNIHFVIKGKNNDRSLVHDFKQSPKPNGCTDIDSILKRISSN